MMKGQGLGGFSASGSEVEELYVSSTFRFHWGCSISLHIIEC